MEGAGLRFMMMAFAAWWSDQQQAALAYLNEENRILACVTIRPMPSRIRPLTESSRSPAQRI
jgi:hypothetical protein